MNLMKNELKLSENLLKDKLEDPRFGGRTHFEELLRERERNIEDLTIENQRLSE